MNSVLLHSLPYPQAENIVSIQESNLEKDIKDLKVSFPDFLDWKAQNRAFTSVSAYTPAAFTLVHNGPPRRLFAVKSSTTLLDVLQQRVELGRTFQSGDEIRPNVVILSHSLWQTEFNSDPEILSRALVLDDQAYKVIGVLPAGFHFPPDRDNVDLFVPLAQDASSTQRGSHRFEVIARLKPGFTVRQAQTEMEVIRNRLEQQYPETNKGIRISVSSLKDELTHDVRPALIICMVAVGLVFLIACCNVANLLLVRSGKRTKELVIRAALGCKPSHLFRLLFTESLVLAALGGLAGIGFAAISIRAIIWLKGVNIPRLNETHIDPTVATFTLLMAIVCTVVVGLFPAALASRQNISTPLNESQSKATYGFKRTRFSQAIIFVEAALSLMLLVEAGLLVKSLAHLRNADPGFERENVYTIRMSLPLSRYKDPEKWALVFKNVLQSAQTAPGRTAAALVSTLPLSGDNIMFDVEDAAAKNLSPGQELAANFDVVSPDYFRVMGITLMSGRFFSEVDGSHAPPVVIIDDVLARKLAGSRRSLPRQIVVGYGDPINREIVGVVGHVRRSLTERADEPQIYLPDQQVPLSFASMVLRTDSPRPELFNVMRSRIFEVNRDVVVTKPLMMSDLVTYSLGESRFRAFLISAFACLALILSMIGIYGVMAFYIVERRHEIGIRMALGATRGDIFKMVVNRGILVTLSGELAGIGLSLILGRIANSFLYGVGANDFLISAMALVLLGGAAFAACCIPALKASDTDPLQVIQSQ